MPCDPLSDAFGKNRYVLKVLKAGPEDERFGWRKLFPKCCRENLFSRHLWKPTSEWKDRVDDVMEAAKQLNFNEQRRLRERLHEEWLAGIENKPESYGW